MKRILISLLMIGMVVNIYGATASDEWQYRTEKDDNGYVTPSVDFSGVDSYLLSKSSYAVMVTSQSYTNTNLNAINPAPKLQPCLVYGLIISSVSPVGEWLVLRDSDTPNVTSTALTPDIGLQIYDLGAPSVTQGQMILFPKPLRVYNGLSANMGPGGATAKPTSGVTILYKKVLTDRK